jgi:hypothetical protein
MSCTTRTKTRVVVKFEISDFVKTQWPTRRRFCVTLEPILDCQLNPLQFLNAKNVWPTPSDFDA